MVKSQEATAGARHVLHPCCRVRQEKFGLLFYDLRGPRLLFAETGEVLDGRAIAAGGAVEDALRPCGEKMRRRVETLTRSLSEKGFLREQPIC